MSEKPDNSSFGENSGNGGGKEGQINKPLEAQIESESEANPIRRYEKITSSDKAIDDSKVLYKDGYRRNNLSHKNLRKHNNAIDEGDRKNPPTISSKCAAKKVRHRSCLNNADVDNDTENSSDSAGGDTLSGLDACEENNTSEEDTTNNNSASDGGYDASASSNDDSGQDFKNRVKEKNYDADSASSSSDLADFSSNTSTSFGEAIGCATSTSPCSPRSSSPDYSDEDDHKDLDKCSIHVGVQGRGDISKQRSLKQTGNEPEPQKPEETCHEKSSKQQTYRRNRHHTPHSATSTQHHLNSIMGRKPQKRARSEKSFQGSNTNNKMSSRSQALAHRCDGSKRRKIIGKSWYTETPPFNSNGDTSLVFNETPIYDLGTDVMAHILSFMPYTQVYTFLTMPLSKTWCARFTFPQDLWKVICVAPPFHVKLGNQNKLTRGYGSDSDVSSDSSSSTSDDDNAYFPVFSGPKLKHVFGKYRLLYASFIKCHKYLEQIKEDAKNGRTPSVMAPGLSPFSILRNGVPFTASSRHARRYFSDGDSSSTASIANTASISMMKDPEPEKLKPKSKSGSKQKFGRSLITERLLGPSSIGEPGPVDLPLSCAIYSVVSWMLSFTDVLGMQVMCLKVLPSLLEDENQRTIAQRAGLTDIVLTGMIMFPDSIELHKAAFHALVLLARPLGGSEGTIFERSMLSNSTNGIMNTLNSRSRQTRGCKNGIAVILDSMRRFLSNGSLQAMGCWSIVNLALVSSQKSMLVKLGAITSAANAMIEHTFNSEVQFRALFALINLVIPYENPDNNGNEDMTRTSATGSSSSLGVEGSNGVFTEKEILDESARQVTNLVVVAMKNFCSSEAIMNRACLVLHNLALNSEYHEILLWTPNCYQMLNWAIANYQYDQILRRSASLTLERLQDTLSKNDELRFRFNHSMRSQQRNSVERNGIDALQLPRRPEADPQQNLEQEQEPN